MARKHARPGGTGITPDARAPELSGGIVSATTDTPITPQAGMLGLKGQDLYTLEMAPKSRAKHLQQVILRIIRERLGLNPRALPKHKKGHPGVKAAVVGVLRTDGRFPPAAPVQETGRDRQYEFTPESFRKTWKQLHTSGQLVETP